MNSDDNEVRCYGGAQPGDRNFADVLCRDAAIALNGSNCLHNTAPRGVYQSNAA